MTFKRIHLISLAVILILGVLAAWYYFARVRLKDLPASVPEESASPSPDTTAVKPASPEKQFLARQAIAVAGEAMIQAKKRGMDITGPQTILRQAKLAIETGEADQSYTLAHRSMEELLTSPVIGKTYRVRRGDTLWTIAKQRGHYGRGSAWVKIWRANEARVPDFDAIEVGQEITIPVQ